VCLAGAEYLGGNTENLEDGQLVYMPSAQDSAKTGITVSDPDTGDTEIFTKKGQLWWNI
jgi:hypothetical protein